MINVIDVGCSFIKSYLLNEEHELQQTYRLPNEESALFENIMMCFDCCGREGATSAIVISLSDSVVWEDMDGNPNWIHYDTPDCWMEGLTPYEKSGHPRNDKLRGAANQMLSLVDNVGFDNIRRILPVSAYVATLLADNPDWNGWDLTHATNSGFYDYTKEGWAKEAEAFIEAGLIDEKIYPADMLVEGNTFRRVFLGGHDSVFSNAVDIPYSSKAYVSCGTWLTVSIPYDMDQGISHSQNVRYIAAPNGQVLKQICFPAAPEKLITAGCIVDDFLLKHQISSEVQVFGTWSKGIFEELEAVRNGSYQLGWVEPHRFHGCMHLPQQANRYVMKSGKHRRDNPYFCEGA